MKALYFGWREVEEMTMGSSWMNFEGLPGGLKYEKKTKQKVIKQKRVTKVRGNYG